MIIATAGHVDHGKTSLVRALTGIDTDRLAEEKRRGLTIDIGFAYADLGGPVPTGFVDVPGHERFVRNMLAGVNAIDLALLVVAADDGPMPQTREHLAILGLLGVPELLVVLTKIDRADPNQHARALSGIQALLGSTRYAGARVFEVATPTGEGLAALREYLCLQAATHDARQIEGGFRLAIDRAFSVSGAGLVVTGAVISGQARLGDTVMVSPLGGEARIRQIHTHGQPAQKAQAGQRCALNLSGADLERDRLGRGQWVISRSAPAPSQRVDVELQWLDDLPRPFRVPARVQVHVGATSCGARLHRIGAEDWEPGTRGFAQLVLDTPLPLCWGDRLILRDAAARSTLGGAWVIDTNASARGRASTRRQIALQHLAEPDVQASLSNLLDASPAGVELEPFERSRNLTLEAIRRLREGTGLVLAVSTGHADRAEADRPHAGIGMAEHHWAAWQETVQQVLTQGHAEFPERIGLREPELARQACQRYLSDESLMRELGLRRALSVAHAAIKALIQQGSIERDGLFVRRPGHRAVLSPQRQALLERVQTLLAPAGLRAPIVGDLAAQLGMQRADLLIFMREMAALGHLLPVAPNRFYLPVALDDLTRVARELASASPDGSFDAAAFRDASGIGRNLTIEVLEYLDRCGITRFAGQRRVMRV